MSIRSKMVAAIAIPTLLVYLTVLGLMLLRLSKQSREELLSTTTERAAAYAARFDGAFERAAAVARITASMMETGSDLTEAQIVAQLRANVQQDDAIYGAAVAFEPGTFKPDNSLVAPYVHRSKGDTIESMNIGREVYDWHADPRWTWWHTPKSTGAAAWTAPYFDKGAGNVLMVTYSAPFKGRNGRFRGVATVDIAVARIRDRVAPQIVGSTEFVILTRAGEFVSSPREGDVMSGKSVFDIMNAAGRADAADAARAAVTGETGVADIAAWPGKPPAGWERWAEHSWVFYAPIRSTGWVFAAMVPESVALAPARARTIEAALALAFAMGLMVLCISWVSSLFTRRVARLGAAVDRVAKGDLDNRLPITSFDELGQLAHDVNTMQRDIKRRTAEIARNRSQGREAMIFALAKLAESRDDDTGKHLERIRLYVELLAAEVAKRDTSGALDDEWVYTVTATAALHDIGKVGIPDAILKKPGKLTDEERKRMQSHTTIGGDTLIAVRREWSEDDFLRIAAEIALHHHEKWDGTGYPYGLAGEDISLSGRIVAVADVYDALTSKRVYKPPMPHEEAVKIITEGAGKHFDPRVVAAFISIQDKFRAIAEAHA